MTIYNLGLVGAGVLIGIGIGIWFALKFKDKNEK